MPPLTIDEARRWFLYEPDTGLLRWREQYGKHAPGDIANRPQRNGYAVVNLNGGTYGVHRIGWALANNVWPKHIIDHINSNPSDNRLSNLRHVTAAENNRNKRRLKPGLKGAHRMPNGRYAARICFNLKYRHIGTFATEQEAHDAYCAVARDLHGEFFNSGA